MKILCHETEGAYIATTVWSISAYVQLAEPSLSQNKQWLKIWPFIFLFFFYSTHHIFHIFFVRWNIKVKSQNLFLYHTLAYVRQFRAHVCSVFSSLLTLVTKPHRVPQHLYLQLKSQQHTMTQQTRGNTQTAKNSFVSLNVTNRAHGHCDHWVKAPYHGRWHVGLLLLSRQSKHHKVVGLYLTVYKWWKKNHPISLVAIRNQPLS